MRIGISVLGSKGLTQAADAALRALKGLGHEVENVSSSTYSLSVYDFLIFIGEPKGFFGGVAASASQSLAKLEGLQGKRCLALMIRRGLRPESALQKFMNVLELEGLVVVEGEVFAGSEAVKTIVQNAPLRRG